VPKEEMIGSNRMLAPCASELSDGQVVRAVVAGNSDLFEELIRRHQKPLVNFLYRMVGDLDLALDMAQDVFTKAFVALKRYDERFRFTTWLYRIASNNAIDHLRRHRPVTVSLDQPLPGGDGEMTLEMPSRSATPAQELEFRETARRLSEAVKALPPAYRQLILLRHVQHLRYDEIAEVSGLPLGTVKNRIFRARALLRRLLDGEEEGEPRAAASLEAGRRGGNAPRCIGRRASRRRQ